MVSTRSGNSKDPFERADEMKGFNHVPFLRWIPQIGYTFNFQLSSLHPSTYLPTKYYYQQISQDHISHLNQDSGEEADEDTVTDLHLSDSALL